MSLTSPQAALLRYFYNISVIDPLFFSPSPNMVGYL
jgi:hypothetical protein